MENGYSDKNKNFSRRDALRFALGAGVAMATGVNADTQSSAQLIRRPIPRSGEMLPVIGLGTYQTFDVGSTPSQRAPLRDVLRQFAELGGTVVDSSPMYGESERVLGDLTGELGLHKKLFVATKVWTSGRDAGTRQMEESMRLLRTPRLDLMQVHNLLDWRVHLSTLRKWKEQGKVRYIGVTHYTPTAYDELASVLETEDLDFVQLNYSIGEREAERRMLPLAMDRRVAVIVNRPFAQSALFSKVRGKSLPPWSAEVGCASWGQFFLKYVVSYPAVTCVIPATSKVTHLIDNMGAGVGRLPDSVARERMVRYLNDL